ncbi:unnamed protein product [Fusarium graminearum]|uniref:Uncharacterized protein n=1 Tax=Gibberella zeae TaxID=5518 RepID=A0A4E9EJB9_GIBZA|nr:unnamed protein product [Fusarium graminearum]
MLADHMQAGNDLNGHDDIPPDFRRVVKEDEEREQDKREKISGRKRQRRGSDGPAVSITQVYYHQYANSIPLSRKTYFPTTSLVDFNMPREDKVVAYSIYQWSQVRTDEQKEYYMSAQELTLAHCFDLDMHASNQEKIFRFYKKHRIPEGVAWRYVYDTGLYIRRRQEGNDMQ